MHAAAGGSQSLAGGGPVGDSIGEKGAAAAGTAPRGGVDGSPDAAAADHLAQSVAASDTSAWRKPEGSSSSQNLPVHHHQKNANHQKSARLGGNNVGGGVLSYHNNGGYGGCGSGRLAGPRRLARRHRCRRPRPNRCCPGQSQCSHQPHSLSRRCRCRHPTPSSSSSSSSPPPFRS